MPCPASESRHNEWHTLSGWLARGTGMLGRLGGYLCAHHAKIPLSGWSLGIIYVPNKKRKNEQNLWFGGFGWAVREERRERERQAKGLSSHPPLLSGSLSLLSRSPAPYISFSFHLPA